MGDGSGVQRTRRWTAGLSQRARIRAVHKATPAHRQQLLASLESADAPAEWSIGAPGRWQQECLTASHLVAPAGFAAIPSDPPHLREDGHHWRETRVHRLTDVTVDESSGLVFHDGRVISESGHSWRSARDGAFLSGASMRVSGTQVGTGQSGPIAPMGGGWNYYHFLIETLPRILRIQGIQPRATPVFSAPLPEYVRGILDALAIDYREIERPAVVLSDDVWICDPVPFGWPHPSDLNLLRRRLADISSTPRRGAPERIHVSRSKASRSMGDAPRLARELADRGYVTVHLEDLPFHEQVARFRGAHSVIAEHGAGLANMVFMAPGSEVLELTSGEGWHPCFRNLAGLLGLSHRLRVLPSSPEHPYGHAATALPIVAEALRAISGSG